jgi:uncharacterized protein YegL
MSKKNEKKSSKKVTVTTTTTTTVVTTTVEKNLDTHYLLVLDRSGSMSSCWKSTIEGLNEQLGTIRGLNEKFPEQRYFLTLVAFDNEIETVVDDMPIEDVKDFDGTEFPPRGMTSLHDAMGISIYNLKNKLEKKNKESENISTALVVIMTDGHENASKEYNSNSIKKLVDELNSTDAWTFSYMGANQNAVLTASSFGISAGNAITYASTASGANVAYNTLTKGIRSRAAVSNMAYCASAALGEVSLDSLNLDNATFFSSVVDGNTIGEDMSNVKDSDSDNK